LNAPTKPNDMIATRTNPIISISFAMIFYCNYVKSKRYMVL
jgi:3-isopropylmalate dehydratase small subunit